MKVQFLPFLFFFDSSAVKEKDLIEMMVNDVWTQKHKAFDNSASTFPRNPIADQGLIVAAEFIAFEKDNNLIRMIIHRSKNESPDS